MTELIFKLMTFDSHIILNYHLSQKLKQIERGKFNNLTNTTNCRRLRFKFYQNGTKA